MAVDIKKLVDAICSLTVLELSKLVKALRDKFGLRSPDSTPIEPEDKPSDEPIVDEKDEDEDEVPEESSDGGEERNESEKESKSDSKPTPADEDDEVSGDSTDSAEERNEPEKESRPVPDPLSVPDPGLSSTSIVSKSPPVKRFKGKDFAFVYAWRYSGEKRYAKIGKTTLKSFHSRYVRTYHPTDDLILLGIFKCNNEPHALDVEANILQTLTRTRPNVQGHEWVEIDEPFNKMIDMYFLSDSDELEKIFDSRIKTEKL